MCRGNRHSPRYLFSQPLFAFSCMAVDLPPNTPWSQPNRMKAIWHAIVIAARSLKPRPYQLKWGALNMLLSSPPLSGSRRFTQQPSIPEFPSRDENKAGTYTVLLIMRRSLKLLYATPTHSADTCKLTTKVNPNRHHHHLTLQHPKRSFGSGLSRKPPVGGKTTRARSAHRQGPCLTTIRKVGVILGLLVEIFALVGRVAGNG